MENLTAFQFLLLAFAFAIVVSFAFVVWLVRKDREITDPEKPVSTFNIQDWDYTAVRDFIHSCDNEMDCKSAKLLIKSFQADYSHTIEGKIQVTELINLFEQKLRECIGAEVISTVFPDRENYQWIDSK